LSSDSSCASSSRSFKNQIADAPDDLAALGRRHARPRPLIERLASRRDCQLDILPITIATFAMTALFEGS